MKAVYAFDIDGVLCHTTDVLRADIEAELGVTLTLGGAYDTFGFHHDSDEVMEYLRQHALNHWSKPSVLDAGVPSGVNVLNALYEKMQLAGWVTRRARSMQMYEATLSWLSKSGFPWCPNLQLMRFVSYADPRMFTGEGWAAHCNDYKIRREEDFERRHDVARPQRANLLLYLMNDESTPKAAAARWMGATHLVEDSAREARMAAEDGLDVIVLRQVYNRDFETLVQAQMAERGDATPAWVRRVTFIDRLEELL